MNLLENIFTDDVITMSIRLAVAAILTGIIGLERQFHQHQAGIRTYILVGVGSCLFMLISIFGYQEYLYNNVEVVSYNVSQIASYCITGISFVCGGLIIKEGASKVKGLTTASSIWVCAGIGLSAGLGMYAIAVISSLIVLASLYALNKVGNNIKPKEKMVVMKVVTNIEKTPISLLSETIEKKGFFVRKISIEQKGSEKVQCEFVLKYPTTLSLTKLYEELFQFEGVQKVS